MEEKYIKKFDEWNSLKTAINNKSCQPLFFSERELWWCSIGVNIGIEIDGKNKLFERPILILKVLNRDMVWCLPITSSNKAGNKFYFDFKIGDQVYSINLGQMRTIDTRRLIRKIGCITKFDFECVKTTLRGLL